MFRKLSIMLVIASVMVTNAIADEIKFTDKFYNSFIMNEIYNVYSIKDMSFNNTDVVFEIERNTYVVGTKEINLDNTVNNTQKAISINQR